MDVWLDDAVSMEAKGLISAARGVYAYCLRVFPMKQAIWRKAAELEKAHGTKFVLFSSSRLGIFADYISLRSGMR